jgi:hypothetical protein
MGKYAGRGAPLRRRPGVGVGYKVPGVSVSFIFRNHKKASSDDMHLQRVTVSARGRFQEAGGESMDGMGRAQGFMDLESGTMYKEGPGVSRPT